MAEQKPEHQDKVISGNAKKVKKNGLEKMADVFVEEDLRSVRKSVMKENIIPGVKELISNTLHNAIDLIFFGESSHRRVSKKNGYTSYSTIFSQKNPNSTGKSQRKGRYGFEEVCVETRAEAEDIMRSMYEQLDQYGSASVMDLYDFAGVDTTWTDNDWGWDDLDEAAIIRRAHDQYVIKMPKPIPIK